MKYILKFMQDEILTSPPVEIREVGKVWGNKGRGSRRSRGNDRLGGRGSKIT